MKRRLVAVAVVVALALVAACARPIAAEHRDMAGTWEAPGMVLQISTDGNLAYRREKDGSRVSIDAPLQQISAGKFTAGIGPLGSEFRLDKPPRLENGAWTMTVDGVALRRTDHVAPPPVER